MVNVGVVVVDIVACWAASSSSTSFYVILTNSSLRYNRDVSKKKIKRGINESI